MGLPYRPASGQAFGGVISKAKIHNTFTRGRLKRDEEHV